MKIKENYIIMIVPRDIGGTKEVFVRIDDLKELSINNLLEIIGNMEEEIGGFGHQENESTDKVHRELIERWLNRPICDVFKEMRGCLKTLNFSYLSALVEEAQCMANKMEAKIRDIKDVDFLITRIGELHRERTLLEKKVREKRKIKKLMQK